MGGTFRQLYTAAWIEVFLIISGALVIAGLSAASLPILFAVHPRTSGALERCGIAVGPNVHRTAPVGYLESLAILRRAAVVVTDSGGLQREAYWLRRRCITVRSETEWVETVDCGANRLVPPEQAAALPEAIALASAAAEPGWDIGAYGDGQAARHIAELLRD